jgi:hypothetical protein
MRIAIGRVDDARPGLPRPVEIEREDGDPSIAVALALIALPRVRELMADPSRRPAHMDDEDVPPELRGDDVPSSGEVDDRFAYVLHEIAWALEDLAYGREGLVRYVTSPGEYDIGPAAADGSRPIEVRRAPEVDAQALRRHLERRRNGLRLFGKYMRML